MSHNFVIDEIDQTKRINPINEMNLSNPTDKRIHKKKKKPFWRRVRHRLKPVGRKYWSLLVAILLAILTACYFMPSLIRFFSGED
jgi:hypothetical protein